MSFPRRALWGLDACYLSTAGEYSRRLGLHGGFHELGPSIASSSSSCLEATLQRLHMRLTTSCRRFGDHLQTTEVCGKSKAIIGRPIDQGIAVMRGAVGWATPTRECRLQLGRITAHCGQVCPEGRCLLIFSDSYRLINLVFRKG